MADTARPPQPEWPVLVAGLGHVGVAVVHRLQALGVPVRALLTPAEMSRQAAELQALGVEIVTASAAWENDLGRQDFSRLGAVVLAADNDSSNVDACLLVRRASGEVPLLCRVSDPTLVRFLRMSVPRVEPFSMGSVTAPVAADMALQLLGRQGSQAHAERPLPPAVRARALLRTALIGSAAVLVAGAIALAVLLKVRGMAGIGAVLATVLTGATPDKWRLDGPAGWLLTVLGLADRVAMISGIALALDWILPKRFAGLAQPVPVAMRGHVVVLGAGNVGMRVAELLHQRRVPVAVIERDGNLKNVQRLRAMGLPVVVGDATVDEVLDLAAVWRAGAVLAMTTTDAVNLHVGLQLSDPKVAIPTVVRLLSPEMAEHASRAADLSPLSPVAETANYVCRTAERMRSERQKPRETPITSLTPDPGRPMGRYAGIEFEAGRSTDQHLRDGVPRHRQPSSPRIPQSGRADTPRETPIAPARTESRSQPAADLRAEAGKAEAGSKAEPKTEPKADPSVRPGAAEAPREPGDASQS